MPPFFFLEIAQRHLYPENVVDHPVIFELLHSRALLMGISGCAWWKVSRAERPGDSLYYMSRAGEVFGSQ